MIKYIHRLPCHKDNLDNKYYKGKKNILDNNCGNKCEFVKSLAYFFLKEYKNKYTLEKCCDVETSENKEPEAIFINRDIEEDKVVIEVKSLHKIFDDNLKKDDKEKRRTKHFTDVFLKKIVSGVENKVDLFLEDKSLTDEIKREIKQFTTNKLLLSFYRKTSATSSRPMKEDILSYKWAKEKKLLEQIIEEIVLYITNNINALMNQNESQYKNSPHSFEIDNLKFDIGKSGMCNSDFSISYIDRQDMSDIFIPEEAFKNRMVEYFKACEKKFKEYRSFEYKRILLIDNKSDYLKDNIIREMKKLKKPKHIDEVWCSFYEYDEVWDENMEILCEGELKDVSYVKVI